MIALNKLFETDQFETEFELIKWARKQKLIEVQPRGIPIKLKEGEYKVPRVEKFKFKGINPRTGRKKNLKKTTYLKTTIPPQDRTLKNIPRDSKKKSKVRFQDWLMLKNTSRSKHSVGQAASGAWLGWSHRAVGFFNIGKEIKQGTIGNKFEYTKEAQKEYSKYAEENSYEEADKMMKKKYGNFKPYKIKTDDEAFEHAERFAKDVS